MIYYFDCFAGVVHFEIFFSFSGDQLDERTAILEGYNSYYSFSKGRSGYSGDVFL